MVFVFLENSVLYFYMDLIGVLAVVFFLVPLFLDSTN